MFNRGQIWEVNTSQEPFDAVTFLGDKGLIFNETSGFILGYYNLIRCAGSGNVVQNFGTVEGGLFGINFDTHAGNNVIDNFGWISSGAAAATITGTDRVYNHGLIQSTVFGDGILITASFPGSALVVNSAEGTIEFGIRALAPISLNNFGDVNGQVNCGSVTSGRDIIVNHGAITGPVVLGHGNDYFDGRDGTAPQIYAGTGNDQIMVGKGDVIIGVGWGYNTLTCGTGADTFMFNTPLQGQFDKIIGFTVGLDKILLWSNVFLGVTGPLNQTSVLDAVFFHVGSHAETAAEHILYNGDNGFLSYDADGSGPAAPIHFATISPHLQLTAADFLLTD